MIEEAHPLKPPWLHVLFGVQAIGWALQAVLGVPALIYASAFPERVYAIGYLVFHIVIAVGACALFVAGSARALTTTPETRFATVQSTVALLVTSPTAVLIIGDVVTRSPQHDVQTTVSNVVFAIALVAIASMTIVASRSRRRPLVMAAGVIALLWVVLGACLSCGLSIAMAGISA